MLLWLAECFELFDCMAARKGKKGFAGPRSLGVGAEQSMDTRRQVAEFYCGKKFTGQALVLIRTATKHHLVPFLTVHLHPHQAKVANVMLGAGMGAPGYVEIHRLENLECTVQHVGQRYRMSLGVAGRKTAALVPCTGNRSAQHSTRIEAQAGGENICLGCLKLFAGDVGNHQVLPHGKTYFSAAVSIRY